MTGQYGAHAEWGEGVCENAYRKVDGVWTFAAFRFYPNFVAPYEGGWASLSPVADDHAWRSPALRDLPPDRPPTGTYRPWPDRFVPPFHFAHPVTGQPPRASWCCDPQPTPTRDQDRPATAAAAPAG